MHNAHVYDFEQEVSRTELANKLTHVNDIIMTVNFTCKPRQEDLVEMLTVAKKPADDAFARALAKECLVGRESTLVCHLSKADAKLGRSLVIEVAT